ncbi:MAG TPA: sugar ABC transporter permease, partial [Galbitalea sp.]
MSNSLGEKTLAQQRSPEGLSVAGGGTRRVSPPVGVRPVQRSKQWRKRFEIAVLTGPAIIFFLAFVIFPV